MKGSRPRVHVTERIPDAVWAALQDEFDVRPSVSGAEGILATVTTPVGDELLDEAGGDLKVVANYGAGVDNIDLAAAERRGIVVANTPNAVTDATAELTVALLLALLRRVAEGDRLLRRRTPWRFSLEFMLGAGLSGKTVGIVGPGRIGRAVGRLVSAFGAEPAFSGRNDSLERTLSTADVVSLHCPLTPATRHLIDAAALARMKPTAVLINTARGPIVDERALVAALERGAIAGAALDVHEHEPAVAEELLELENVVLTPHLGSGTRATREQMGFEAIEALRAVLIEGRPPDSAVVP